MSCYWRVFLVLLLLCARHETELSITFKKLVYQKDMSEYCRRRVMPSVFLGRQVDAANSHILHFSRLELPYSCFISVRTESGSNIILVIQLMSQDNLEQSCKESGNQLTVYEISETFGGYWGPLPDHLMNSVPPAGASFYTMRTTQEVTTVPTSITTVSTQNTNSEVENQFFILKSTEPQETGDYIRMEIPIVNVSAKLIPGKMQSDSVFNIDDSFDIMYDVTPGVEIQYRTSVLPLAQFSIDNVVEGKQRGGGVEWSPRYWLDYNLRFTPDSRLVFPSLGLTTSKKKIHRYNYNVNRRINFKKSKQLFAPKETPLRRKQSSIKYSAEYTIQPFNIFTRHYEFIQPPLTAKTTVKVPNSWEIIEDIMRNLNKSKNVNMERHENDTKLLQRISDMDHNISAYLAANISSYKDFSLSTPQAVTSFSIGSITWRLPSVTFRNNILEQLGELNRNDSSNAIIEPIDTAPISEHLKSSDKSIGTQAVTMDIDRNILKVVNKSIVGVDSETTNIVADTSNRSTSKSLEPLTGSLVDHESWENVVQSAPVMAVILNQSVPYDNSTHGRMHDLVQTTQTAKHGKLRKKRYIHPVPIENARPRKVSTVKNRFASTRPAHKISDAQELAEFFELQDDELQGRVALRYLRQYVGPVLFNICDYSDATARHVYLFNSSRLVLGITNFTMERMTVVVTAARTLFTSEQRCAGARLECQVSGVRVCIDSLSACDGIPNCGSYDIYDEDRLMCGAAAGLQHNVCLAAFTFLAVLLTILYVVHYWLKRCVPKVSDAFFIYTDAAENVLYLDTIMRSPSEGDEGKSFYKPHIFQEEAQYQDLGKKTKSCFKRFIDTCLNFFRFKRDKLVSRDDIMGDFYNIVPESQRMYSFNEEMMCKNLQDTAVQTGPSLEMKTIRKDNIFRFPPEFQHTDEKPGTSKSMLQSRDHCPTFSQSDERPFSDELSMLKFFKQARSVSIRSHDSLGACKVFSPSKNVSHISEEEELNIFDLERSNCNVPVPTVEQVTTTSEIHMEKPEHNRKRLRFGEETTTIPSVYVHGGTDDTADDRDDVKRRSVMAVGKIQRSRDQDTIEVSEEQEESKEYKSYFWSSKNKAKKAKKKNQVSLRKS